MEQWEDVMCPILVPCIMYSLVFSAPLLGSSNIDTVCLGIDEKHVLAELIGIDVVVTDKTPRESVFCKTVKH